MLKTIDTEGKKQYFREEDLLHIELSDYELLDAEGKPYYGFVRKIDQFIPLSKEGAILLEEQLEPEVQRSPSDDSQE